MRQGRAQKWLRGGSNQCHSFCASSLQFLFKRVPTASESHTEIMPQQSGIASALLQQSLRLALVDLNESPYCWPTLDVAEQDDRWGQAACHWMVCLRLYSEPPAYFDICASELPAQWKIHEELKANSDHVGTKHNTAGWHFSSTIRIATTAFPPAVSTACLRTCWHISEESVSIKSMISWQNELPREDPRENWVENVEIRWNQLYLMGSDIFGVGAAGAPGTLVFVFVYLSNCRTIP